VLLTLVEAYENKHYDFGPADAAEAIKFRMEQQGLTAPDMITMTRSLCCAAGYESGA
jgi:HTH-type transcriptional regulator/antitoxin HigA